MQSVRMQGDAQVTLVDVPEPEPGPGEVVVATQVSALCGSEMKSYRGAGSPQGNSGHEAVGLVAQLGAGVTSLQVGQRVGVSAISGCGHCAECTQGRYTWCPARKFYGNMHAERFVIAAHACHPLPAEVGWDVGVLITGDGFGVPYHTSLKLQDPAIETVAIFGAGPIGLGNLLMQRYQGRTVIAVDVSPTRLELATELGAQHVVQAGADRDVVAAIRALTGGKGADVCLEAAGRPETAKQCFAAVRMAGTVVFNGEQPALPLSPSDDFIRRDITAVGSWYYHFNEYPAMLNLYRQGLPIGSLITHHFPLAQADEAFRLMAAGATGKVLLTYSD
ncbi:MAG: zinc-binding dehydrogenase [Caldilineaceae bacterium]|nr:zinc-binding dehydrogenase [Caldilineaceae bacterium]